MKDFKYAAILTAICLLLSAWWGANNEMGFMAAIVLTLMLGVMEVSLSFDNAVVNASVLKEMDHKWQQIFLTVGILIAVVGMRLVFPIVIVAVATGLDLSNVATMALERPEEYSKHLQASHVGIAAFGGMFLLLIFFSFLFDKSKELHWLGVVEKKLASLGKIESISVMLALFTLFILQLWLPLDPAARTSLLVAGMAGVILFIGVSSLDSFFAPEDMQGVVVTNVTRSGLAGFLYLEVLDASFSFDGVIGAFAITRAVVIIMLGLAIGAVFVRSLTIYLVRKGTLDEYVYLEHGAHYAIGALAVIMLNSIVFHVPEVVTGLIGVTFIISSIISSMAYKKRSKHI